MQRNTIIVVGYPKSGNTWLARLTAQLVGCPARGYLGSDHADNACEGDDRTSDFVCVKSHHQLHELERLDHLSTGHLIYVIRDPRDVAVSAANFFRIKPGNRLTAVLNAVPRGPKLYAAIAKTASPESYRLKHAVDAVLHGSERVHHWCRVAWKNHYSPFREKGVLFVRYEDMLSSPETECARILEHLGLQRDPEQIQAAINSQSFAKRKKEFVAHGNRRKARFLRSGRSQQWKSKLTPEQQNAFIDLLEEDLEQFSYDVGNRN